MSFFDGIKIRQGIGFIAIQTIITAIRLVLSAVHSKLLINVNVEIFSSFAASFHD